MITIIFEAHLASGHNDIDLSPRGEKEATLLGERYKDDHFDAIFCSDLQRSYRTAQIAFADRKFTIIKDARLRECDYGRLTQHPKSEVEALKANYINMPFPEGESYRQTAQRMRSFLEDLQKNYQGKKVMIIGHRATQYGLEYWINTIPLEKIVIAPWSCQQGWVYSL